MTKEIVNTRNGGINDSYRQQHSDAYGVITIPHLGKGVPSAKCIAQESGADKDTKPLTVKIPSQSEIIEALLQIKQGKDLVGKAEIDPSSNTVSAFNRSFPMSPIKKMCAAISK